MKLGTYVELLNYVDDTVAAGAYYSKLGLVAVGDDVLHRWSLSPASIDRRR